MAKLDLNPGETMIGSGQMPPLLSNGRNFLSRKEESAG